MRVTTKVPLVSAAHVVFCSFEISLDGILFIPCLEQIIIYDKDIKVINVTPKCATLDGAYRAAVTLY